MFKKMGVGGELSSSPEHHPLMVRGVLQALGKGRGRVGRHCRWRAVLSPIPSGSPKEAAKPRGGHSEGPGDSAGKMLALPCDTQRPDVHPCGAQ